MKFLSSFTPLIDSYDGFLLDLWGVIHDGSALYPGVAATLQAIRDTGKPVVFVSNAPRRAAKAEKVLNALGVEHAWYRGVVTSGEAAFTAFARGEINYGRQYYFIGPQRDADVIDGLGYQAVSALEEAQFLLNAGFGSEEQTGEDFVEVLARAASLQLPMVCLNPDLEVVKQSGDRFPCAGILAADYARLGGEVVYFGKPYSAVYQLAFDLMPEVERERMLAVGDSLHTDIAGGVRNGVEAALVTGGIMQFALHGMNEAAVEQHIREQQEEMPGFVVPGFGVE